MVQEVVVLQDYVRKKRRSGRGVALVVHECSRVCGNYPDLFLWLHAGFKKSIESTLDWLGLALELNFKLDSLELDWLDFFG